MTFRTSPEKAWRYPELELRSGNSWPLLALDCDDPTAVLDGLHREDLPRPNIIVQRRSNEHSHIIYTLTTPVHRGERAREKPLKLFKRIAEFYREAWKADPGYTGVLNHNPMSGPHQGRMRTYWQRERPYSLAELAEPIPSSWRVPKVPMTAIGRHVGLFDGLRRWCYQPRNWGADFAQCLETTKALNELYAPSVLSHGDVVSCTRSVHEWVKRRVETKQWTQTSFAFLQAARGRASGKARHEGSREQLKPWEAEKICRATWYNRRNRRVT